jgi:7,8-dihydropterin-6-yl-methyl-4-(beta-D-ribofuranosyl)aminobenzene 5'-phosphate synthase
MNVNITILVENTTPVPGFRGEYGFAALITVDDKKILFDTGSEDALLKNAAAAGVDLAQINELIISHGHFDHTGAVIPFLQTAQGKKVYAHAGIFIPRYTVWGDFKKAIGVPFNFQEIDRNGAQFIAANEFTEIYPGVFVTGEIPRKTDFEDVGGSFYAEAGSELEPDLICDDMSVVINHPGGLIIISGCAHAGIINTIEYARQQTGQNKIRAFIGGTHLAGASEERMNKTIKALKEFDVEQIIACHCTGFEATVKLRNALGNRVMKGETAMNFQYQ